VQHASGHLEAHGVGGALLGEPGQPVAAEPAPGEHHEHPADHGEPAQQRRSVTGGDRPVDHPADRDRHGGLGELVTGHQDRGHREVTALAARRPPQDVAGGACGGVRGHGTPRATDDPDAGTVTEGPAAGPRIGAGRIAE
jgi:hypothetical protein